MRRAAVALVVGVGGCGGGDAAIVDASCPVAVTPDAPEGADAAPPPDAAPPDASWSPVDAGDERPLDVRWSFTENGEPVFSPADARSVLVTHIGAPVAFGAAPEVAYHLLIHVLPTTTELELITIDSNAQVLMITYAAVPPDSDHLDVVLPYIDEPRAQLADLGARVQSYVASHGSLPPSVAPTPVGGCCLGTENVCPRRCDALDGRAVGHARLRDPRRAPLPLRHLEHRIGRRGAGRRLRAHRLGLRRHLPDLDAARPDRCDRCARVRPAEHRPPDGVIRASRCR
jgi:hypothetical protein